MEKIASKVGKKSKKNFARKGWKIALKNDKVKSWKNCKKIIKKWKIVSKVIWKVEKRFKKFEKCWKVEKSVEKLKKMQTFLEKSKKVEKNEKNRENLKILQKSKKSRKKCNKIIKKLKKYSRFVISARRSDYESVKNSMSSLTWVVNHWRVKDGVEKLSWRNFGNHQSVKNVNGLTCLSRKSLKSEKCSRRNGLCESFIIIGMWKKINVLAGSTHNLWRAKNALEKTIYAKNRTCADGVEK